MCDILKLFCQLEPTFILKSENREALNVYNLLFYFLIQNFKFYNVTLLAMISEVKFILFVFNSNLHMTFS